MKLSEDDQKIAHRILLEGDKKGTVEPITLTVEALSKTPDVNIIDSFSLTYTNRVSNFVNDNKTSTITQYQNSLNEPEGRIGSYKMTYKLPM